MGETVGTEICPAVTVINNLRRNQMVKNKNLFVRNAVLEEARARIERGDDPELLVHFIDDNPARGMSNGITLREFQKGGYISRYYRLKDLANPAYWIRKQ